MRITVSDKKPYQYYGMQTVKVFGDINSANTTNTVPVPVPVSRGQFWKSTGIAVGLIELLTLFIVIWKRQFMKNIRKPLKKSLEKIWPNPRERRSNDEESGHQGNATAGSNSPDQIRAGLPPPALTGESGG